MLPFLWGVRMYPAMLGVAGFIGALLIVRSLRRNSLALGSIAAALACLACGAFGGAKLYYLIEMAAGEPVLNQGFLRDGFRQPGGIAGLLLAIPLAARITRIDTGAFADLLAVPICFSMAVQRIGCFVAGCCFGTISDVPWAVRFPERSRPWLAQVRDDVLSPYASQSHGVHPLQLYFAAWSLGVVLMLLLLRSDRGRPAGTTFLLFIVLNETGKAVLERFRYPDVGGVRFDLSFMSLTFAAVGVLVLAWLVRNQGRRLAGLDAAD